MEQELASTTTPVITEVIVQEKESIHFSELHFFMTENGNGITLLSV